MFSPMNALSNQSGSIQPPAGPPEIEQAEAEGEGNEKENGRVENAPAETGENSQQLYSASRQLSAASEVQSDNNYTGVRLDISQNMEMGVHDKTAQMVIETNVRLSIESRFENIPVSDQPSSTADNEYTPEETAGRLLDFAERFMNGFLEETETDDLQEAMQEFVDEVAGAAEEGFEEARQELGGSLSASLETLFNQVHDIFMEQLAGLGEANEVEESGDAEAEEEATIANRVANQNGPAAAEQAAAALENNGEENLIQDIIAENNRIAAGSEGIPGIIADQLDT